MARFGHSTTGAEVVEHFKEWGKTSKTDIRYRLWKTTVNIPPGPSVGGIGAETTMSLAAGSPARIILAGRSLPEGPTTY